MNTAARALYAIRRTASGALPVYTDIRNTKHTTLIRHVQGNSQHLVDELSSFINATCISPPPLRPVVNGPTNTITLNGRWRPEVVRFLESKGF